MRQQLCKLVDLDQFQVPYLGVLERAIVGLVMGLCIVFVCLGFLRSFHAHSENDVSGPALLMMPF
jgi:hypothetical protein